MHRIWPLTIIAEELNVSPDLASRNIFYEQYQFYRI